MEYTQERSQERYEEQYKEFKDLLELRKKNLKFKELEDEEDYDSDERQLLEAYEDLNDDLILKFIKAFDNIFEVRDYMISIAQCKQKATYQEGQIQRSW